MLSIALNTHKQSALCIGGGKAAEIKVKTLLKHGLNITIISPELTAELSQSIFMSHSHWVRDYYTPQMRLEDFNLKPGNIVLACTEDSTINQQIQKQANAHGLLCYRADHPKLSDFQFQAQFEAQDFKISIKHQQSDHKKSIAFKNYLQGLLDAPEFLPGKVYLAGFGPGDPDLMTLKTRKLILDADIIFHDDLIGKEVLEHTSCEKVYVGKRKGQHYKTQDEINELLFKAASQGLKVLRLKGGDPFIFGRGGEEYLFLKERGISVEVIPGISSSLSASASALTPLTHRGVSKRLTFMSAHHVDTELTSIPSEGTLVLYMGASKLEFLSKRLIELGLAPDLGVTLVYNASQPDECIEHWRLDQMFMSQLKSPLSIIIGEVVSHFNQLHGEQS